MDAIKKITAYLASSDDVLNLSQTKWNKLLFFIDSVKFCKDKQTFTGMKYLKFPYGPVPENYRSIIYNMVEDELLDADEYLASFDSARFLKTNTENNKCKEILESLDKATNNDQETLMLKNTLDKIIKIFGQWTAVKLSEFSHLLDAWRNPGMYEEIQLGTMKNDTFLKKEFKEGNFANLVLSE